MNTNEQEIERLLRNAPKPMTPTGLKEKLTANVTLTAANVAAGQEILLPVSGGWLRRWWPALLPAAASLVGVVVLAFQQMEIRDLKDSIRTLSQNLPAVETVPSVISNSGQDAASSTNDFAAKEQEEIARLKQLAKQLAAEVGQLEQMRKENDGLRTQLATPAGLTQDELDALAKAKESAMSINCVNNMKQFLLAARMWAMDENNVSPPDMLSTSNYLGTPTILFCPADTNRVKVKSWKEFSAGNCSYDYLTPSVTNAEYEPMRVMSRCPIHGTVGMCDGSVQREVAKKHPEWLKERDGKLYYEPQ